MRYADDSNIFVKSPRAGERLLASVTHFLEKELKLTINTINQKKVASTSRMKFLGFTVGHTKDGVYPYPVRQSKIRIKQALRRLTKRNRGVLLDRMLQEIQLKMRGWLQYYGFGKMKKFVGQLDMWL